MSRQRPAAPRIAASLAVLAAASTTPRLARADVSSWLFAGGGYTALGREGTTMPFGTLQLETGVGTSPSRAIVVGGLFKTITDFGGGTDLALAARAATGGFVRGDYGFAIDAGGYERWWGPSSRGFYGSFVLGGPWGIQAAFNYETGTESQHGYGAVLGVDLLRLTVYRTTGSTWFPNPFPATR